MESFVVISDALAAPAGFEESECTRPVKLFMDPNEKCSAREANGQLLVKDLLDTVTMIVTTPSFSNEHDGFHVCWYMLALHAASPLTRGVRVQFTSSLLFNADLP